LSVLSKNKDEHKRNCDVLHWTIDKQQVKDIKKGTPRGSFLTNASTLSIMDEEIS